MSDWKAVGIVRQATGATFARFGSWATFFRGLREDPMQEHPVGKSHFLINEKIHLKKDVTRHQADKRLSRYNSTAGWFPRSRRKTISCWIGGVGNGGAKESGDAGGLPFPLVRVLKTD